jgi:hypothetical protein
MIIWLMTFEPQEGVEPSCTPFEAKFTAGQSGNKRKAE